MKTPLKYTLFLLLAFNVNFAQVKGIYDEYLKLPEHLKKVEGLANTYELKVEEGIISLQLNPDSTFIYKEILSKIFYKTIGKYNIHNNTICLNWDSIGSYKISADKDANENDSQNKQTIPIKIANVRYNLNSKSAKLIKQPLLKYDRMDLFFTSKDIYSNPFVVDYASSYYFDTNKNKFIIRTYEKKEIQFNPNSIWGFRGISAPDGHYTLLTRIYKDSQGFLQSIPIVQFNKMIIYKMDIGNGRGGGHTTAFSKNLDSEIFRLSKNNLKKCYTDNQKFLALIKKSKWRGCVNGTMEYKFKVVELYQESLR